MERTAVRGRLTWQVVTVTSVIRETDAVRTIGLEVPDWPGHRAGKHLDVRPAGRHPLAFVCGPTSFVETAAEELVGLGYPCTDRTVPRGAAVVHAITAGDGKARVSVTHFSDPATGHWHCALGVGRLTLGGGFGWLTLQYELSCDNLLSAQVVTAAGEVLRASREQHPDLLWSLRGGGGNFGVVTEFEFQLHPVGPLAQLCLFFWDLEDGAAALALAQQVTADLPPRMGALIAGLNAPPAPFVPEHYHFRPGYALIVAAFGADAEHARLAGEIRSALPPLFEFITPIPYTGLQQILDESAPWGILAYEKSLYLDTLSPEVISIIAAQMPRKQSSMSLLIAFPVGGAFCQVPDEATAFGGSRAPGLVVNAAAIAPEPGLLAADRDWARQLWAELLPHAPGLASYVNFMNDYEADRVRASYGPAKYQRLAQVKAAYDPGNVFHRNPSINPAG